MKTIKKAQNGVKKSSVKKGPRRTTSGMWVDENKFQPPFPVTYADEEPKPKVKVKPKVIPKVVPKVKPKAKNGTSLGMKSVKAGFDKNPGVTRADIIVAAKKKAKSGTTMRKAEDGYTAKQNRLARQEKRVYNRYTNAKASGNIKKSGRLYDKLIDKQTKSIKAGVDVQYKAGGSMKKCKYGCK